MSDSLDPLARALIDTAITEEEPPHPLQRARVKRAVLAGALVPGVAGAATTGLAQGAPATMLVLKSLAWATTGLIAGLATIGAVYAGVTLSTTAPSDATTILPSAAPSASLPAVSSDHEKASVTTTGGAAHTEEPQGAPTMGAPTRRGMEPPGAKQRDPSAAAVRRSRDGLRSSFARDTVQRVNPQEGARGPQLGEELAELERVQSLLREGKGDAALEVLDSRPRHGSVLADERLASEVFAACQAEQWERARRAAVEFIARAPNSPLATRVRNSCAYRSAGSVVDADARGSDQGARDSTD